MKKILLLTVLILSMASISFGASSRALADNTLVTDSGMLRCLRGDSIKSLTLTGAATDTFAVIVNGATIYTITLEDTTELWHFSFPARTFKVNWTGVAGSPAATLDCYPR